MAIAAIEGDRTLAQLAEQFDVHPNQITSWKTQLESGAADVFGPGGGQAAPAIDVKSLHAEIGQPGVTATSRYEPGVNRAYQELAEHYDTASHQRVRANRATKRRSRWWCKLSSGSCWHDCATGASSRPIN